jgi:MFS family permease
LCGALALASRSGVRGLGRWIATSATVFGVALIAFAWSRMFWLSLLLLIPVGMSLIMQMASSNTLVQSMTPDSLRGRVMAIYTMMLMGMAPFGALLGGTLAEHIGAPAAVTIGGFVCVTAALVFATRLPVLRVAARQLIMAQENAVHEQPEAAAPS